MNSRFIATFLVLGVVVSASGQTSSNGNFSAELATQTRAKNAREQNTWTAKILDRQGGVRYQLTKQIPFDVQFPSIVLADDGGSVVLRVFEGIVEFYGSDGNLVKSYEPFGRRTAEHEQIIKCSVAGNRVALLFSTPDASNATVVMMTLRGEEMWRSSLKAKHAGEVFLSTNGKLVAAGSYEVGRTILRSTEVFDDFGMRIRELNMLFRTADIADDGRIVLADKNNIVLASLIDKNSSAAWTSRVPNQVITSARWVRGFVAFVIESVHLPKGSPMYEHPSLIVLNLKGNEVARTSLRSSSPKPAALGFDSQRITLSSARAQTAIALSSLK